LWIFFHDSQILLIKDDFDEVIFLAYTGNPILNQKSMMIYKCDICEKEIKDNGKEVRVATDGRLSGFTFCEKCAKPLLIFLRKHKLLKE
jgi:hypothetical protein